MDEQCDLARSGECDCAIKCVLAVVTDFEAPGMGGAVVAQPEGGWAAWVEVALTEGLKLRYDVHGTRWEIKGLLHLGVETANCHWERTLLEKDNFKSFKEDLSNPSSAHEH